MIGDQHQPGKYILRGETIRVTLSITRHSLHPKNGVLGKGHSEDNLPIGLYLQPCPHRCLNGSFDIPDYQTDPGVDLHTLGGVQQWILIVLQLFQ
jgi:hypothetical protein